MLEIVRHPASQTHAKSGGIFLGARSKPNLVVFAFLEEIISHKHGDLTILKHVGFTW